jgi:hypothetical protein
MSEKEKVCEACGAPATRKVELAIDEHWYSYEHDDWVDGDCILPFKAVDLCDECNFGLYVSPKLLKRMAKCVVPDRMEEERRSNEAFQRLQEARSKRWSAGEESPSQEEEELRQKYERAREECLARCGE